MSTLAFRLFVVLFILRTGASLRQCELVFGWSKSTIEQWLDDYVDVMHSVLDAYRRFPSREDQQVMALEHWLAVSRRFGLGGQEMYKARANYDSVDGEQLSTFMGAFGAVDGTYTICARFPNDIQRQMYTGYKKFHAYKLLVICSMFTKAVLSITVVPARTSDSQAYASDVALTSRVARPLLGDDAFHGYSDIVIPFSGAQIRRMAGRNPIMSKRMSAFNTQHSSNRMSSEHVIGSLKEWAWVRGTSKYRRYNSHATFVKGLQVVKVIEETAVNSGDEVLSSILFIAVESHAVLTPSG